MHFRDCAFAQGHLNKYTSAPVIHVRVAEVRCSSKVIILRAKFNCLGQNRWAVCVCLPDQLFSGNNLL